MITPSFFKCGCARRACAECSPRMFSVCAPFNPATILAHVKRGSSNLYERVIVSGLCTARWPFGGGEQQREPGTTTEVEASAAANAVVSQSRPVFISGDI